MNYYIVDRYVDKRFWRFATVDCGTNKKGELLNSLQGYGGFDGSKIWRMRRITGNLWFITKLN